MSSGKDLGVGLGMISRQRNTLPHSYSVLRVHAHRRDTYGYVHTMGRNVCEGMRCDAMRCDAMRCDATHCVVKCKQHKYLKIFALTKRPTGNKST